MNLITDINRTIRCGECGVPQTVQEAYENGASCIVCQEQMCVYCGCTERSACINENKRACAWSDDLPGGCDTCFFEVVENDFYREIGEPNKIKEFVDRRPHQAMVVAG